MAEFEITFARSARRELESLDPDLSFRILGKIEGLAAQPFPRGAKKIRGSQALWRLRVGDYRVIYSVSSKSRVIDIVVIRHRRDVYL